ncbi:MAG: NAD(P)H-dependent glycerol-3-phosphate dehydrogenase, partial [Alphaproteobacteria bacterium]|nr:NAD(P)H-dependent glycerol-3-phosphate dehydrogenase [Alphaproteobacteria bacterium]
MSELATSSKSRFRHIGVIGGGAWGTALAASALKAGRDVRLWAREREVVDQINSENENRDFLPGVALDLGLRATPDLAEAAKADALLLVCPAQYMRPTCQDLADHLKKDVPLVICAKGVEKGSLALMSEIVGEILPGHPLAVLSGPTFAREVAEGKPTAITLACADHSLGEALVGALGHDRFRPYLSGDVIGAQVGGAVKNVLAIATGIAEGQELGANASAALITRGLAEIVRLGLALGARQETMMGLSGLGDLVLTCSSPQS